MHINSLFCMLIGYLGQPGDISITRDLTCSVLRQCDITMSLRKIMLILQNYY